MTGKEYLEINKNTIGIYWFHNIENDKYYIGQALDIRKRFNKHMSRMRKRVNYPLYNALNKYGLHKFEYRVVFILNPKDKTHKEIEDELNKLEIEYIAKYNSFNNGYNLTIGGESISGYHQTEETKLHLSKIAKEVQNDGRNKVYVYNIKTKEYSEWSSLKEFFRNSGVKSKHIVSNDLVIVNKQWIASRSIENLQEKINNLDKINLDSRGSYVCKNNLMDKELIDDLNKLTWKDFCNKYFISKSTYYNYRRKLL